MVNITSTHFTSFTTTITTTSHSHLTTTLFIPTTLVTTIVTTLVTVFPTATELGIPTTATFTNLVSTASIDVQNVNLSPPAPLIGLYILAGCLMVSFVWLSFEAHWKNTHRFWKYYIWMSTVIWILGLVATILSKTISPDRLVAHELWAVHFNIASDSIAVGGALGGLICSILTDLLQGKAHLCALAFLTFICAAVGLFSSVCSLYGIRETPVGRSGGWYIGMLMWLVGLILFSISEHIFVRDSAN